VNRLLRLVRRKQPGDFHCTEASMTLSPTHAALCLTLHGRGTHSQSKPYRLDLSVRIEAHKLHQIENAFD
jgi:hypothetical protein